MDLVVDNSSTGNVLSSLPWKEKENKKSSMIPDF